MATVTVRGLPVPKGSMKCIGARGRIRHQLIASGGPELAEWVGRVVAAGTVLPAIPAGHPVVLQVIYSLPRPKSHYRTGKNSHLLRDAAPATPTGHNTGDLDKLQRAVGDALQEAGTIADDAQITTWLTRKRYAGSDGGLPHTGAKITLWIDNTP